MTLREYIDRLRGRTVAVIGIGVSNTPLLRLLLREGISVTACDRSSREKLGALAGELEAAGAKLQLGDGYLQNLSQDVIFRTPGLRPDVPELEAARAKGSTITSEMEVSLRSAPAPSSPLPGPTAKRLPPPSSPSCCGQRATPSMWAATSAIPCWRRPIPSGPRTGPCWSCPASS